MLLSEGNGGLLTHSSFPQGANVFKVRQTSLFMLTNRRLLSTAFLGVIQWLQGGGRLVHRRGVVIIGRDAVMTCNVCATVDLSGIDHSARLSDDD